MLDPLAEWLKDKDVSDIKSSDYNAYLVHLRTRERADLRPGNLSATTIGHAVRAIKTFSRWCREMGYADADPSARLKSPRIERLPESLTLEQVQLLKETLIHGKWQSVIRDRALVFFLLETGCRAAEVLCLTLDKLSLELMYADVLGKGNKTRRVGFTETTRDAVKAYLGNRTTGSIFQADYLPNPVLKCERQEKKGKPASTPLKYEGLRMILLRLSNKTDIPLHCHLFRHTFGTLAVADGMDPSHVQTAMGHANIATTYLYVAQARQTAALKAMRLHSPLSVTAKVRKVNQ